MLAVNEDFWAKLDARVAANQKAEQAHLSAEVVPLSAAIGDTAPSIATESAAEQVLEWGHVLETISAAKATSQKQDALLREQDTANEELRRELGRARQETEAYKGLVEEMRAQTESKAREMLARTEARVQLAEAHAHAQVSAAEERARAAEQRAATAEDWLERIEQATRDLFLSSKV